jgi:hypothetical protein
MKMATKKYAWYSVQQCELAGYNYWRTIDGNVIEASVISSSPTDSGCAFDDIVFVAEVSGVALGKAMRGKMDIIEDQFRGRDDEESWKERGIALLEILKQTEQKYNSDYRWN